MALKSTCLCFKTEGSRWIALAPDERHAYRVQCAYCGKFLKWGTAAELGELQGGGAKVAVKPYKPPALEDTVMGLFVDD